jgi:homocysteine S-methyltransferase
LSEKAGRDLLSLSVRLALEARDEFWREESNRMGRIEPLVAASIGPYGAYLADGSEYTGRYDIPDSELLEFHRERWDVLANRGADLMACETLPAQREAEVLLRLLAETPGQWAWMSFSCRDGKHLSDGGLLRDAVRACSSHDRVAAVGINRTAPEFVASLVEEARRGTDRPIIVYPNSGEVYDPVSKRWHSPPTLTPWEEAPEVWIQKGACGVGGCCRVGPGGVTTIRRALMD